MEPETFQWEEYYNNLKGRKPRELLLDVLKRFTQETPGRAIDLGCGDGTETAFLLDLGWSVLAVDREAEAFTFLKTKIPPEAEDRLQTQVASFEAAVLSPAELIYAGYSVPFCHPASFAALWQQITDNIVSGGRFAGQLFGVHDTWASNPEMTFFTREQAEALFSDFDVEHFREEDQDGSSTMGPKHWHVFHVIARKK